MLEQKLCFFSFCKRVQFLNIIKKRRNRELLSALLKRRFGLSQWENVYKISIGSISESKPCKSTKQVVSLYNFIWSIQRKLSRSFHLIASPWLSNRAEILYCNLPPVTFCAVAFVWQFLQVVFVQVTLFLHSFWNTSSCCLWNEPAELHMMLIPGYCVSHF